VVVNADKMFWLVLVLIDFCLYFSLLTHVFDSILMVLISVRSPILVYWWILHISLSCLRCNVIGLGMKLMQGLMKNHEEIVEYFKTRGVSAIFLFRRNLLRRMISVLANSYDRDAKPLNGTHKSHVHSPKEVSHSLSVSLSPFHSLHVSAYWSL